MSSYDLTVVRSGIFRVPPRECLDAVLSMDAFETPP